MNNTNPKNTPNKNNREELEKLLDKAIRPSPAQLPEVDTEHKDTDLDYISYVPLDKKNYDNYIETFGRRITDSYERDRTTDEEGRAIITYTTKAGGGELKYSFDEDLLVSELGKDATKKLPTLGRRASNLWYSMIYFAKEQGDGVEGNFTASELMRLWGIDDPSKGGRAFKDIRETFFNIVAVMPSYTNKRSGDERLDWGFSFTSSYLIKGEGREARYYYTMTPEALGLTEKWLKGELSKEDISNIGGYLQYPLSYLQSGLEETEQNFRDYLVKFKGGYTVKAYTILKDWLKLRNDLLRRRKYCHELLYRYLENAKGRGEISNYKFEVKTLKDWRKKWKVTIYKSTDTAKVDRTKRGKRDNTTEQDELIDTIFEWQNRPVQGIKTPPSELLKQIANTVGSYGVDAIRDIYKKTALGATPSTYDFWQEVKRLKR